jgi:hypothetical protein
MWDDLKLTGLKKKLYEHISIYETFRPFNPVHAISQLDCLGILALKVSQSGRKAQLSTGFLLIGGKWRNISSGIVNWTRTKGQQ